MMICSILYLFLIFLSLYLSFKTSWVAVAAERERLWDSGYQNKKLERKAFQRDTRWGSDYFVEVARLIVLSISPTISLSLPSPLCPFLSFPFPLSLSLSISVFLFLFLSLFLSLSLSPSHSHSLILITNYTTFSSFPSLPFFLSTAVYDTKGEETRLRNETTGAKSISKNLELQLATLDNEASRFKNIFIL